MESGWLAQYEADTPERYLDASTIVDLATPEVARLAGGLDVGSAGLETYARLAFEHVRDAVAHSCDLGDPRVTVAASEVAHWGVGLCYAKSHLLVALLRARGIPAGLCYQRLADGAGHVVHGLVAVYLAGGWHRLDPRGNKPGVDARFSLGEERLAWAARPEHGEFDYPRVYREPHPAVLAALRQADDALVLVAGGLPDRL